MITTRIEEHPMLAPSDDLIKDGDLQEGELICNLATGFCWYSEEFDVLSIKADVHVEHEKFRKMLPIPDPNEVRNI